MMAVKDVTDLMVCRAVQKYQDAMRKIRDSEPKGKIYGIGPPSGDNQPFPYEALSLETGQPEKVCYRAMERAERHGLLECGVSLRTGWLTEKGKELLSGTQGEREKDGENSPETRTEA